MSAVFADATQGMFDSAYAIVEETRSRVVFSRTIAQDIRSVGLERNRRRSRSCFEIPDMSHGANRQAKRCLYNMQRDALFRRSPGNAQSPHLIRRCGPVERGEM